LWVYGKRRIRTGVKNLGLFKRMEIAAVSVASSSPVHFVCFAIMREDSKITDSFLLPFVKFKGIVFVVASC
jgi:hypothetical protein